MIRTFVALCIALYFTPFVLANEVKGQSKDIPYSQVLSNYIGEWDDVYTSETPPFSKGKFTAQWVLDGEFVEVNGDLTAVRVPEDIRIKELLTFDREDDVYRKWTFVSNGRVLQATGTWDEASRTMTWISKTDDGKSDTIFTKAESFGQEGMREWTTVAKKPNDVEGDKSSGRSIRRQR